MVEAGCDKLVVHARKAWLHGLNPKQNRTIPPLHYEYVYRIKEELPAIPVVLNGNINEMVAIINHLEQVDGVMLGRLACQNPYAIAMIHHALYPESPLLTRTMILERYIAYAQSAHLKGVPMSLLLKPIFNLAHGLAGARAWKAALMEIQQSKNSESLGRVVALISAH